MAAIIGQLPPVPLTARAATEMPMEVSALLIPPPRPTERLLLLAAVLGNGAIVPGKRKREGAGAAPERHGPPPRSRGDADGADGPDAPLMAPPPIIDPERAAALARVEEADARRKREARSFSPVDALAESFRTQAIGDGAEIDESAAEAARRTAAFFLKPIGRPSCPAAPPAPPARLGLLEYLVPKTFAHVVARLETVAWLVEEASAREVAVERGVGEPEPEPYPYPYP